MNTFSVREVNAPWRLQSAVLATVILFTSSCDGRIEDPARPSTDNEQAKNGSESDAALNLPMPEFEHFVVKARNDEQASKLPQTLAALLKDESRVRPLFDKVDPVNDPDEMRLMLRVSIPKQSLPSDNNWENAYWLERKANLEVAEPDEQTTLENTLEVGQLCLVDNEPPSDKGWSLKNEKAVAAWNLQPPATGKKFGEGIDVCHPDTGWAEHLGKL